MIDTRTWHTTLLIAFGTQAFGDVITYSGPLDATRSQFVADTDGLALLEDFESFADGDAVGDLPGNDARFAEEYADGSPAPLPLVIEAAGVPSGSRWMGNFGNGRPAFAEWVIRPDDPADRIYAFGQVNAQGDWVRIEGFDDADNLVVSVDAQPIVAGCFAGFVIRHGVSKVVVTPIGNFDGFNGMDDVMVSTDPIDICEIDLNCDGMLNFFDIEAFIALFNAGDLDADFQPDGMLNFFDIAAYISSFQLGCP